jgi:hypothetical protein
VKKSVVIVSFLLGTFAFYLTNRFCAELLGIEGISLMNFEQAFGPTLESIRSHPFYLSFERWPVLIGSCFFITVLFVWTAAFSLWRPQRAGEEYGSARWGTYVEAKKFMVPRRKARRKLRAHHA